MVSLKVSSHEQLFSCSKTSGITPDQLSASAWTLHFLAKIIFMQEEKPFQTGNGKKFINLIIKCQSYTVILYAIFKMPAIF